MIKINDETLSLLIEINDNIKKSIEELQKIIDRKPEYVSKELACIDRAAEKAGQTRETFIHTTVRNLLHNPIIENLLNRNK